MILGFYICDLRKETLQLRKPQFSHLIGDNIYTEIILKLLRTEPDKQNCSRKLAPFQWLHEVVLYGFIRDKISTALVFP